MCPSLGELWTGVITCRPWCASCAQLDAMCQSSLFQAVASLSQVMGVYSDGHVQRCSHSSYHRFLSFLWFSRSRLVHLYPFYIKIGLWQKPVLNPCCSLFWFWFSIFRGWQKRCLNWWRGIWVLETSIGDFCQCFLIFLLLRVDWNMCEQERH